MVTARERSASFGPTNDEGQDSATKKDQIILKKRLFDISRAGRPQDQMQACFFRALPRRFGACNLTANAPTIHHGYTRLFHAAPIRQAQAAKVQSELEKRIAAIPIERFRNFCIVAHVDHGKSTLSDRLLEITGVIEKGGNAQSLDRLDVERERGITVKAQTCTMLYNHKGLDYMLHLVDTPGHVDFRAEVSRSYASCGGGALPVNYHLDKDCALTGPIQLY